MKTKALILACLLLPAASWAGDSHPGVTALPFLKVPLGARGSALGGAHSALSSGAESHYWNPAGLGRALKPDAVLGYSQLLEGLWVGSFGMALHVSEKSAVGLAASHLSQSDITVRDRSGADLGEIRPNDLLAQITYARRDDVLPWGVSLKYIRSSLGDFSANAFAADAGLQWAASGALTFALGARNLGPGIEYEKETEPLPRVAYAGSGLELSDFWRFTAQMDLPKGSKTSYGVGTEIAWPGNDVFSGALRAGYNTATADVDGFSGLRLGLGTVWHEQLKVDYTWVPVGNLGETHWLAVGFQW